MSGIHYGYGVVEFQAMGELEYYVISENDGLFPATDQRGYHESAPYAKFNDFRTECMSYIAQAGGQIKYGHSEVGNFTLDDKIYEQNEIEFLPVRAEEAADQLVIAKWVIRNLASQYGYNITFAPKITAGKAGSGLHIHMRIMKDGQNQMLKDGALSETARKAIAGMMKLASSITLSVIQILLPIFVWFLIRKHRPTFAGATATVRYWYAFRWAGRQKRICACWQIRWRPQVIMILHRNRRWKCVRLTVRPICIN